MEMTSEVRIMRGCDYGNMVPVKKSRRREIVKRKKEPPTQIKPKMTEEEKKEKYLERTNLLSKVHTWIAKLGKDADADMASSYLEKFNMFLILGGLRPGKILMPIPACMLKCQVKVGEKAIDTSRLKGPAKLVDAVVRDLGCKTLIVPRTINKKNRHKLRLLVMLP